VPVRTEASDKSELSTQLIFGDAYTVLEKGENGKWIRIKNMFDEYEGWIDFIQHNEVSPEHFEAYLMTDHPVCYDDVAVVDSHSASFLVTYGSTLPFLNGRNFKIGKDAYTYQGELYQKPKLDPEFLKFSALRYMNAPYLWGGKTLFGADCSGFMQQIFKICGYKIMRDAYQQVEHGTFVDIKDIQTGDLAFFENDNGRIIHVGMILDANNIIHAHGKVRIDVVDEKGILNLTTKKYSHKLSRIKRIIAFD
jgi:hypothetical protein